MCLHLNCPPEGGLYKTALNLSWHTGSEACAKNPLNCPHTKQGALGIARKKYLLERIFQPEFYLSPTIDRDGRVVEV